ncbi:MAG TPA: hypothetical protein VHU84_14845 [Lacipirellulaceae bacterium]|jgi:hypothetical protein|nr:hypothetical protein [Lacipirellulaceae bacterium]
MKRHLTILTMMIAVCGVGRMAAAALLLAVDADDRGPPASNTLAGFSSYKMTGTTTASSTPNTQAVGAYTVTMTAFDDGLDENNVTAGVQNTTGQIDDRLRTTPTNSGSLTYADLYDDIIFAGASTGPTGGLDLSVSGGALVANTPYLVSIYSFDSGSTPAPQPRTANWLDGNNANALVVATTFNGGTLPMANDQYKFTGVAMTDASGQLLLHARNTTGYAAAGGATIGVVINGFEIAEVPEPTSLAFTCIAMAMLAFRRIRSRVN